jgi:hypothetical protein
MVNVLVSQGRLNLVDEGKVSVLLANVSDADGFSLPSRVYFATAISAGIVKLTAGRAIEVAHSETRSDVAVMLDRVQTRFRLPPVRPAKPPMSLGTEHPLGHQR